jgi:hypothetical protein
MTTLMRRLGQPLILTLWLAAAVSVAAGATPLRATAAAVLALTIALVLTDDRPPR